MRILGQIVLHQAEGLVLVPVGILDVEDFDVGVLHHVGEALNAFVVDHRRDAPQHDDLAFAAQLLGHPFRGVGAHGDVVARHIQILDRRIGQPPVHDRDIGAVRLDLLDRAGQLLGGEGQDDQGVQGLAGGQVL